ncbi:MAG: radical SAM protein [Candidatus Parcubacteria bacterium]|nr:radical SAM protein [Candidatus Parcubacteria bacterium]
MTLRICSRNPDLLLPEIMAERIQRITDFWGWRLGELQNFDRLTVFVTHRCNLRCHYCNGPHMDLKSGPVEKKRGLLRTKLHYKAFKSLLEKLKSQVKVKHIHFTGGEATLNPQLPQLVKMASEFGILSSLTTNGTAPFEFYRQLIANGLTEIRISLDSDQAEKFDAIVKVKGTFAKVTENIRRITQLRDEQGADIFLILNACVSSASLAEMEKALDFFLSLKPNDIKFLTIAQDKENISLLKDEALTKTLQSKLNEYPPQYFPLLRKKIANLFDPEATGFLDPQSAKLMKSCFIPLTERTIDGKHYYPCSIYLRYLGQPIGHLSESFKVQQRKTTEFVRQHDCKTDPICSQFCTNCCKTFNLGANQSVATEGLPIIQIPEAISSQEIIDTLNNLSEILTGKHPIVNLPFMVIKPYGQTWRKEILRIIEQQGLDIAQITTIPDWASLANCLYCWPLTKPRCRFGLENKEAFNQIESGPADIIWLKDPQAGANLADLKIRLRKLFPGQRFVLKSSAEPRVIRLNAIHTPDPSDLERENKILQYFFPFKST